MEISVHGQTAYAHTGGRPFDPSQIAVVLVHGAGMDHTVWSLQSRYLAHRGLSVLAVDLPGHGRSAGAPLAGIAEQADWLLALLDALGLERAVLVGHSMGALAALDAAGRAPARVAGLVLLGAAERMPVHPDLLALAANGDREAIELVIGWGHGPRGHVGGCETPGLALLPLARRLMQSVRPGALGVDLAACNAYTDAAERAAAVTCPALLVLGAADRMTPAKAGRALAARIRGAEAVVLPAIGHMLMGEAPEPVARQLARFALACR